MVRSGLAHMDGRRYPTVIADVTHR